MKSKKTLVIGASAKSDRYSYKVIHNLVEKGYDTVAIGQREGEIFGVKIHIKALPFKNVDTVTLYLNPIKQKDYYDYIIGLQPKRVIFNPGTENPELYKLLQLSNIKTEIACTLVLLSTDQY